MASLDKSKYFFLDYLRTHKFVKDRGYIKKDKRMLDPELDEDPRLGYVAVCQRLFKDFLEKRFKLYNVTKPRGLFGYQLRLFTIRKLYSDFSLFNFEPESPWRVVYSLIDHKIREEDPEFRDLQTATPNFRGPDIQIGDGFGFIKVTLSRYMCGMWEATKWLDRLYGKLEGILYNEEFDTEELIKKHLVNCLDIIKVLPEEVNDSSENPDSLSGVASSLTDLESYVLEEVSRNFSCDDSLSIESKFLLAVGALKRRAMRNENTGLVGQYNSLILSPELRRALNALCEEEGVILDG